MALRVRELRFMLSACDDDDDDGDDDDDDDARRRRIHGLEGVEKVHVSISTLCSRIKTHNID